MQSTTTLNQKDRDMGTTKKFEMPKDYADIKDALDEQIELRETARGSAKSAITRRVNAMQAEIDRLDHLAEQSTFQLGNELSIQQDFKETDVEVSSRGISERYAEIQQGFNLARAVAA